MAKEPAVRIFKYQIFPCKGGYLLNINRTSTHGESEVYTNFMTVLTRIADIEGELEEPLEVEVVS